MIEIAGTLREDAKVYFDLAGEPVVVVELDAAPFPFEARLPNSSHVAASFERMLKGTKVRLSAEGARFRSDHGIAAMVLLKAVLA
jgi:hypothetical protein